VGAAYYRMQYLATALDIVHRQRRLLDAAVQTSTTRYATGVAPQSDPLQARLARDRLEAEEATLLGDRRAARAAVNALRNRAPDAPLEARPLDVARLHGRVAPLAPQDVLVTRAVGVHPRVAVRRAALAQARQAIRLERLAARPDLSLMLEYEYRGRVAPNLNTADFASLFVGVRLPVWAWRKQFRLADAARADSAAAAAELQEVEAQLARDVAATWARASAAQRRLELLVDGVLPTARATVESVVRSYEVGRIEFVTVIAVEDALFRAEIEAAAVAADYQLQVLTLRQLTGEEERP
ncbi:MAG: TolC family protein, partial [Gemmatimonadales bacterium]